LATTHKWERLATVDTSVTLHTIENLKEKSQYYFRVSAENEIGAGETAATEKVSLQTHARTLHKLKNTIKCQFHGIFYDCLFHMKKGTQKMLVKLTPR